MIESICTKCKNWFYYQVEDNMNTFGNFCVCGHRVLSDVTRCSHFSQKPEPITAEGNKADELLDTGDEPRNYTQK